MNHINEGLVILDILQATLQTKEAYCLHPVFQNDEDLSKNFGLLAEIPGDVVGLVMEYRNIANQSLSDIVYESYEDEGFEFAFIS